MQVRVKLMGVLKQKTPDGGKLDLSEGSTLEQALLSLDISGEAVQAISINGKFERDLSRTLEANDELVILAPVSGG